MKTTLTAGLSAKREFTVERESTIGFMGEDARVYATPMLVRDIEITCRELLLEHLDPGEDSVGSRVEINHLAPTLLGMKVTIEASVSELKGRAVTFDITASDGLDQICRGRHMRFIVSVEQTRQRLKQKQARAA
ncbi:MAG TPA: thioesterase family protein [Burkholderiales bacterium]|jgi:predicted thioesterase|nr:thioesterase family protein [Burkholderiales bacterium]